MTALTLQRLEQFRHALRQRDQAAATEKHYVSDLKQFVAWAAATYGTAPDTVQALDIMAYRQHLQAAERRAPATVNRRIAALRAYCTWQVQTGATPTDEGAAVGYVKVAGEGQAPAVLTHAETLRLFKACQGTTWQDKRDAAIIQLFVQAGLRLSELCDIRLQDVHTGERSGTLAIPRGKGNKARTVPLNATARAALAEYLRVRPPAEGVDHVFLSQLRRPISSRAVQALAQERMRAAGIEGGHVHALRHLCASNVYAATHDILTVQGLLGHADISQTMRYTHAGADDARRAVESTRANVLGETERKD